MLPAYRMRVSRAAGSMSIDALDPTTPPRWRMLHGNLLGRSRWRSSSDPLAPALFGWPVLGFCTFEWMPAYACDSANAPLGLFMLSPVPATRYRCQSRSRGI